MFHIEHAEPHGAVLCATVGHGRAWRPVHAGVVRGDAGGHLSEGGGGGKGGEPVELQRCRCGVPLGGRAHHCLALRRRKLEPIGRPHNMEFSAALDGETAVARLERCNHVDTPVGVVRSDERFTVRRVVLRGHELPAARRRYLSIKHTEARGRCAVAARVSGQSAEE